MNKKFEPAIFNQVQKLLIWKSGNFFVKKYGKKTHKYMVHVIFPQYFLFVCTNLLIYDCYLENFILEMFLT